MLWLSRRIVLAILLCHLTGAIVSNVSHILTRTKEEAVKIKQIIMWNGPKRGPPMTWDHIKAGMRSSDELPDSFGDLAEQFSLCPSGKGSKGHLGQFGPGMMKFGVPAVAIVKFDWNCFRGQVGTVLGPIEAQDRAKTKHFGWELLFVHERHETKQMHQNADGSFDALEPEELAQRQQLEVDKRRAEQKRRNEVQRKQNEEDMKKAAAGREEMRLKREAQDLVNEQHRIKEEAKEAKRMAEREAERVVAEQRKQLEKERVKAQQEAAMRKVEEEMRLAEELAEIRRRNFRRRARMPWVIAAMDEWLLDTLPVLLTDLCTLVHQRCTLIRRHFDHHVTAAVMPLLSRAHDELLVPFQAFAIPASVGAYDCVCDWGRHGMLLLRERYYARDWAAMVVRVPELIQLHGVATLRMLSVAIDVCTEVSSETAQVVATHIDNAMLPAHNTLYADELFGVSPFAIGFVAMLLASAVASAILLHAVASGLSVLVLLILATITTIVRSILWAVTSVIASVIWVVCAFLGAIYDGIATIVRTIYFTTVVFVSVVLRFVLVPCLTCSIHRRGWCRVERIDIDVGGDDSDVSETIVARFEKGAIGMMTEGKNGVIWVRFVSIVLRFAPLCI
jgi:hypothetical protein